MRYIVIISSCILLLLYLLLAAESLGVTVPLGELSVSWAVSPAGIPPGESGQETAITRLTCLNLAPDKRVNHFTCMLSGGGGGGAPRLFTWSCEGEPNHNL